VAPLVTGGDEAGIGERFQLERDRTKRYVRHGPMNVARRQLVVPQQPKDLASPRRGNGGEKRGLGSHDR
jgi:hypothetical protein